MSATSVIPSNQRRIKVNGAQATIARVSGTTYRILSKDNSTDQNSYINQANSRSIEVAVGNFGDGIAAP